jgi:predicted nucleic acid-binding protein
MSLYLDTSCLLKLLFAEPERLRVYEVIQREAVVVISDLARLEASIQIKGREEGRAISRSQASSLRRALATLVAAEPFHGVTCPGRLVEIASHQVADRRRLGHCRTLDRLHLAAMEGLGLGRLLTNDDQQASAARALGFDVLTPR